MSAPKTIGELRAFLALYPAKYDSHKLHFLDMRKKPEEAGLITRIEMDQFDDEDGPVLDLVCDPEGVLD